MRLVAALACACVLACGNKQSESPAARCAAAAQQGVDAMVARAKQRIAETQLPDDVRAKMHVRTQKLEQMAPRLRAIVTNRCVDDKWKRDVIDCYAKMTSMEEMRACRAMLPPDQQARLEREELDLFANAMAGPPGFGSAAPAKTPEIEQLEAELRVLNAKLADAAKGSAAGDVQRLQQQMQEINAKLAAARAAAAAQPAPPAP